MVVTDVDLDGVDRGCPRGQLQQFSPTYRLTTVGHHNFYGRTSTRGGPESLLASREDEAMFDIVIAGFLSAVISCVAIWWQHPSSEVSGILNVIVVFTLTFAIYFTLNIAIFSDRTKEVQ